VRLPAVLTPTLFAEAELSALTLDGDAFRLGDAVVPTDVPETSALRAQSIASAAEQYGLVAERWTAAWVHGVTATAPRPHQVCNDVVRNGRTRMVVGLREVLFQPDDVVLLGGLAVTAPLRTAADLARLEPPSPELDPGLAGLLELAGVTATEAAARLAAAPRSPFKRRGVRRLKALGTARDEAGRGQQARGQPARG
jgi:AbiEi antitoxin C-terminal domain